MFQKETPGEVHLDSRRDTTNSMLAAALLSVGIPLSPIVPAGHSRVVGDGIATSRTTWYFEAQSADGRMKTAELMAAWDDMEWHTKHPEHPFAYVKCAMLNYERLIDHVKRSVPLGLTRKRSKIALVSLDADQALQDRVFRVLDRR